MGVPASLLYQSRSLVAGGRAFFRESTLTGENISTGGGNHTLLSEYTHTAESELPQACSPQTYDSTFVVIK